MLCSAAGYGVIILQVLASHLTDRQPVDIVRLLQVNPTLWAPLCCDHALCCVVLSCALLFHDIYVSCFLQVLFCQPAVLLIASLAKLCDCC
jgi:hypothetical protein